MTNLPELKEAAEGATPITDAYAEEMTRRQREVESLGASVTWIGFTPPLEKMRQLERSLTACQAELERAREEIASAKAFALVPATTETVNANRYLYLRNDCDNEPQGPIVCDWTRDDFDFLRGEDLDYSIDAAIAAQKG